MRTATLIITWIVRIAGIVQIVLGLLIWAGPGLRFLPIHIPIGFLIVICLWILAILALIRRGQPAMVGFAFVWGLALPAFGMAQAAILVGRWHWIIRVTHLLMGVIALAAADRLSRHVLASRQ
jgi:hypothetical protein